MTELLFSKNDKQLSYLWFLTEQVEARHVKIRKAFKPSDVYRHKRQVIELIEEITRTLKNFHLWSSGQGCIAKLLEIRLTLESYNERVFVPENTIVTNFNKERDNFHVIIGEIFEQYEP